MTPTEMVHQIMELLDNHHNHWPEAATFVRELFEKAQLPPRTREERITDLLGRLEVKVRRLPPERRGDALKTVATLRRLLMEEEPAT